MKSIGIDIGTTTISTVVMDPKTGAVLDAKTVSNDTFLQNGQSWERIQDVERIVNLAKDLLDTLLTAHPECEAIGLTGQMHGIVYVNAHGTAVSSLYTWQDGRGNLPEFGNERSRTLVQMIEDETGISCHTGYGLVTHLYQSKHNLVPVNASAICSIADYFGMTLTGRTKPLVHTSNAASFGFFDVEHGRFMGSVMESLGIDTNLLPEVTDSLEVLGTYRGIPVTMALGDNQASFLGAVGEKEHAVLLNMGTGGQISVLSKQYLDVDGVEVRPFLEGSYLLVGASLCGGRAYSILEQFFRTYMEAAVKETDTESGTQYRTMEILAARGREKAKHSRNALAVTATFCGTRTEPDLRGSISGISEENFTPENLVYGFLCGMAEELYGYYRCINEKYPMQVECLVGSGNGLRKNAVLVEIFQELFGAALTLSTYEEEAACGAARSSQFSLTNRR